MRTLAWAVAPCTRLVAGVLECLVGQRIEAHWLRQGRPCTVLAVAWDAGEKGLTLLCLLCAGNGKDSSSSMQQLVLTEGMVLGGGAFSRVSVAKGGANCTVGTS